MGLFSFIKSAGQKLLGKKEPTIELTEDQKLVEAMRNEVSRLGIPVGELSIDIGKQVLVSGKTETNSDREKIILALGNVEGISCVDDSIEVLNPEPESTFHTVQSGDSLSKIAKEVYGDPMKYNAIFEANQPMLSHPDKIYPGQILRIPPMS